MIWDSTTCPAQEWLNLKSGYASNDICHACRASKNDYMKAPSQLASSFRHTLESFIHESLKPGPKSDWAVNRYEISYTR